MTKSKVIRKILNVNPDWRIATIYPEQVDKIWREAQKEVLLDVVNESEQWDRERLIEVINKKLKKLGGNN